MNNTSVAHRLRKRIGRFSGDVSEGLCVRAQRFVSDMIYGIQASESVMLTEIGRTLEESIALRKTHERLSRNLQRPELESVVQNNVLRLAGPRVGQDTLLVIDPSDLSKKYAKEMEYLARVRDGSAHDFANGYWTVHVMGTEVGSETMLPLYQRLWSAKAPDFESENEEILRAVDAVQAHAGQRGIWTMDRGGDRINLFGPMLDKHARFLFRLRGDRHLVYQNQQVLARDIAKTCPCRHTKVVTRIEATKERSYTLRFGYRQVRLPEREEPLFLLVIHGFGEEPLMLLTTEQLNRSFKHLWWFVQAYMKRWSIEETIRYTKTCYDLENVRVLTYQSLQNLMPLVLAVMFFCACVLDHDARLRVMAGYVEWAAKRLFGIPDFKLYALADGIRAIFARNPGPPSTRIRPPTNKQLALFA
jgi:hypothetical protein